MITEINDRLQIKQIEDRITFRIIDDERDKTMVQSMRTIKLLEILDYDALVNSIVEKSNRLAQEEVSVLKNIEQFEKYQNESQSNYYEMEITSGKIRIPEIHAKQSDLITLKDALDQLKEAISK